MDFVNNDTRQIAKNLLGVKVIYQDTTQTYTGYIVETEAYLGLNDRAAHGYGGKITPKVTSLYKRGGTIYAHVMHTHLLINFVTKSEGIPEGVLIRAIEPEEAKAFNIPRAIDGATLNDCRLSIDTKNRKYPKDIIASPRIGIPNKGDWTHKSLRYTVKGNPFVSRMRKSDCMFPEDTWK
nr:DNA-3-methyladenine glycosylase [Staphylococcus aureus]